MSAEMTSSSSGILPAIRLQWGRAQMSAEIALAEAEAAKVKGFNGAALR